MALITCDNVSVGYGGKHVAANITCEVDAGDYLVLVGENGSGKSTFVRTLLGLQAPLAGSVRFADDARRRIGYLPQRTDAQSSFPASVREVVYSGFEGRCGSRPFRTRAEKRRAADALERVGAQALARSSFSELSGGQQQRVLLARALCAAENVLVLDEPVTGLDARATAAMYELVSALNHDDGMTVVMVSHDVEMAVSQASHVLYLDTRPLFDVARAFRVEAGGALRWMGR